MLSAFSPPGAQADAGPQVGGVTFLLCIEKAPDTRDRELPFTLLEWMITAFSTSHAVYASQAAGEIADRTRQYDAGRRALGLLRAAGVVPSPRFFVAWSACCRSEEQCRELLREQHACGLAPTRPPCNCLLGGTNDLAEGLSCYRQLRELGFRASGKASQLLLERAQGAPLDALQAASALLAEDGAFSRADADASAWATLLIEGARDLAQIGEALAWSRRFQAAPRRFVFNGVRSRLGGDGMRLLVGLWGGEECAARPMPALAKERATSGPGPRARS